RAPQLRIGLCRTGLTCLRCSILSDRATGSSCSRYVNGLVIVLNHTEMGTLTAKIRDGYGVVRSYCSLQDQAPLLRVRWLETRIERVSGAWIDKWRVRRSRA